MTRYLAYLSDKNQACLRQASLDCLSMTTLSERIIAGLENASKTPAKLARDLGITDSAVSQWINGLTKNISSDRIFDVARSLRVNPEWLATGKGNMVGGGVDASMSKEAEFVGMQYDELPETQKRVVRSLVDSYQDKEFVKLK